MLDSEDFLVSNLLLPLGSLVYLLFCVTRWGWGFDKYLAEANTGAGVKMPRWLKPYFQFILPVLVLVILLQGLPSLAWRLGVCIAVAALVFAMAHRRKA